MKIAISIFSILISSLLYSQNVEDNRLDWPREIQSNEYTITLYQPQIESLKGNSMVGRMALSIKDSKESILFGALWFNAKLITNTDTRTAVLQKLDIPKIIFPDIEIDSKIKELGNIIIKDLEATNVVMSLDRIIASAENVERVNKLEDDLNNKSPDIYFRKNPTVLVNIDGEPVIRKDEESDLEYVINTPFLITKKKKTYYLKGGEFWFEAREITSTEWKYTKKAPKDVQKFADAKFEGQETRKAEKDETIPEILVVTKPSELIISVGELEYKPISGTSLLYVTNTESDIIMNIDSQEHFLLLNGRWYRTKTLKDANWVFTEPTNLPEDFILIPADDENLASIRVSIPGTPEAKEAVYEQYIPQTAIVDRKTATVNVTYDGDPQFKEIEGTTMFYAINTPNTIIKIDATYYCVDDGIWFESYSAIGPWKVSDTRPEEIEQIPPNNPVYNVKYVYIYDSTPEVVYVGYTPGYYNAYVYGGVVVYGTGYYYYPWYGYYYYPRPVTYGYAVHYNPYAGWGFAVGVTYGWVRHHHYRYHRYWGATAYRHGYRHGHHHAHHHGYKSHYNAHNKAHHNSNNVYQNRDNGVRKEHYNNNGKAGNKATTTPSTRPGNTPSTTPSTRPSTTPSTKPNNVYADKNGNVHQRDNNGNWSQKNNSQKPSSTPSTSQTPNTKPAQQPSTRNSMESNYNNRSRGSTNYNNYNNNYNRPSNSSSTRQSSPSTRSSSRPSGGRRRG